VFDERSRAGRLRLQARRAAERRDEFFRAGMYDQCEYYADEYEQCVDEVRAMAEGGDPDARYALANWQQPEVH